MKFVTNIDLGGLQLQNPVLHPLASAPSSPQEGRAYWNTTVKGAFFWNGTAWRPTDAAMLTDGSIQLSALATNQLARTNHTGSQTASTISDLATTVKAYRQDEFAAPTASVAWGNQRITSLADPTAAQDAATKNYVDNAVQSAAAGIDSKPSVRAIATSNITLSGTQTIDGVSLAVGDRVLAAGQTTASANGVYVVASGAWSRATDADSSAEVTPGAFWFVEEGSSNGKTQWRLNNSGAISLGTTALTIVQFGAAGSYTAGDGLLLTGSVFSVQLDTNSGLIESASGLKIDTAVVARKFSGTITGTGALSSFTVTHNLGTTDVIVMVKDSSNNMVLVDVNTASTNTVTLAFGANVPNAATYRVTVVG